MKIVLFLITFITAISIACPGVKRDEGEIFLIPENYVGTVAIFFDMPNGKPIKYEGKYRVYEINKNGILLTQFKENLDVKPFDMVKYYYFNEKTKKRRLLKYLDTNEMKYVISDSTFIFAKAMESGLSNKDYHEYKYLHFIVGKMKNIDSLYEYREKIHLPDLIEK